MAKHIKDLKDLRALRISECYRHSGPTDLKRTRDVFPQRERRADRAELAAQQAELARLRAENERLKPQIITERGGAANVSGNVP